MLKEFEVIKDLLLTMAAMANLVSLMQQAPIDPLLKGFLLGFLTAAITLIFLTLLLFRRISKTHLKPNMTKKNNPDPSLKTRAEKNNRKLLRVAKINQIPPTKLKKPKKQTRKSLSHREDQPDL